MLRKWLTICINYQTTFDFETAWASGSGVTRKHFKDKIFLILWARHPENLAEKRTNTELIRIFFQTVPQNHKN